VFKSKILDLELAMLVVDEADLEATRFDPVLLLLASFFSYFPSLLDSIKWLISR
jgi:hypothetical protein